MQNYKNTIKIKATPKTSNSKKSKRNEQIDLFGFSILGIASQLEKQSIKDAPEFNPKALQEPKSSLNVNAPAFQPDFGGLNPNAKEYSPSKQTGLNANALPYQHQSDSSNHGPMMPTHLFKAIYGGNENYYYDISNDSSTTESSSAVSYEPQHYSSTAFYQQQEEADTTQIGGYATDYDSGYSSSNQNKQYSTDWVKSPPPGFGFKHERRRKGESYLPVS